jgi:hypothetical protein
MIEFLAARYPGRWPLPVVPSTDWTPSALPPVEKDAASGKKPRSYANAVAEVIFGFLALLWLLLVPEHPYLLLGPGAYYLQASPVQLAPVLITFYWWVVALNVLQVGWRFIDLMRGSWRGPRRAQSMAMSVIGLIPLALLLTVRDHAVVLLKHPELNQAQYGANLATINHAIQWSAGALVAITLLSLVWEIGKMALEAYRKRAVGLI